MIFDFHLPFDGRLSGDHRWVILSQQIPWDQIDSDYASLFKGSHIGCPAKPARVALCMKCAHTTRIVEKKVHYESCNCKQE